MAYASLGSINWGTGPVIPVTFYYDKQRSGASMKYKIKISIAAITGASYFGYPIYSKIYLDGSLKDSATLKSASPSRGSSAIVYETGWITISNKTTGTTNLKVNLYSGSGSSRNNNYTYSMAVDEAKSSIGSVSNFNIGDTIKVPVTKYNSSFRDNLRIYYGGESVAVRGNYKSNTAVTFTDDELADIYSKMSTLKSGTFTFRITTYTDDSMETGLGYDETTAKGSITGAAPTFDASQITYKDTNSDVTAITGNNQHIVQNQSTLQLTVTAATGNKGATISKYEATLNGVTKSRTSAGSFSFGSINASSNLTLTIKVTDSRGNTRSRTKTITILEWKTPTASILLYRLNNFEADTYLTVNANYSSVNSKNTITIEYRYKKTSASSYSSYVTIADGEQQQLTFDNKFAWHIQIKLTDKFTSKNYTKTLNKGVPIMFIDTGMLSVGIGMFPSGRGVLELNGQLAFNGGIPFKQLWTGTLAPGESITVPDIGKYNMFAVRFWNAAETGNVALYVMCSKYSTALRGFGGFADSSDIRIYGVNLSINGTTVTADDIGFRFVGGSYEDRKINAIYGIF